MLRWAAVARVRGPRLAYRGNHTSATEVHAATVPGWFEALARHVAAMPETVGLVDAGLPYPYTVSIVGMTVLLRAAVSVPLVVWQRRRNDRLSHVVLPEWSVWKQQIPAAVWNRRMSSHHAMSTETKAQIQRMIKRSLQEKWEHLVELNNCSPMRTTLVSLAVHVPLFVVVSMLLRQGALLPDSPFLNEVVPWWSPDETFLRQMSASRQILLDKGLDARLADGLTQIHGPTLANRDSSHILPILIGSLTMLNAELSNWTRRRRHDREAALGLSAPREPLAPNEAPSTTAEPLSARVVSNALRVGAVVSIPVAAQMPSALLVYWLTSSLITFVQTVYFARADTFAERQPRADRKPRADAPSDAPPDAPPSAPPHSDA
ncbi:hypothetical protein MSPP1_003794 [Malassezia sp. CBS 17886]|nr:hypothetical protein MSPP1_003794 [Malassezia sp. CBS 17886]